MANPEHVEILKQGYKIWNKWRSDNPDIKPDLKRSNLTNINLVGFDLVGADLSSVNLKEADLKGANLYFAYLRNANLSHSKLTDTDLRNADFTGTDLSSANLGGADLNGANLEKANLSNAILINVDLSDAIFNNTECTGINLETAFCGGTIFADIDLSTARGLDTMRHRGPSTLGADTIFKSKGKIPEIFLRGCGLQEILITFLPSMMNEAIEFYSCFISYSHADKEFAKRLHDRLQGMGIRCWLDEYQLNPGDKLHSTIYEAIRVYDKVILCCSETALKSWWVEHEFEKATIKEADYDETVLIPLTLDNYLFEQSADHPIIDAIREKRVVLNFSNWKDHDAFERAFEKVVKALRTDGGKPPPPTSKLTRRK